MHDNAKLGFQDKGFLESNDYATWDSNKGFPSLKATGQHSTQHYVDVTQEVMNHQKDLINIQVSQKQAACVKMRDSQITG